MTTKPVIKTPLTKPAPPALPMFTSVWLRPNNKQAGRLGIIIGCSYESLLQEWIYKIDIADNRYAACWAETADFEVLK